MGRYGIMIIKKIDEMIKGWFVGNFEPTAYKTDVVEVSYKKHKKNEQYEMHYQTQVTEVNLLISGEMIMHGKKITAGDIFIMYPFEISDQQFLEDCEVICIKIPGSVNDKIVVEKR